MIRPQSVPARAVALAVAASMPARRAPVRTRSRLTAALPVGDASARLQAQGAVALHAS